MNRFQRVREILDEAVGGAGASVGFHGAFWRNTTRDRFVAARVFGLGLVIVGDGAGSNLVRALKGEAPFGADLPEPPAGARFNRMPSGREPVPAEAIAEVERWIDDGCPDDAPAPAWRPTNAPIASSRTDDIWFLDAREGWAVNSNGQILHTTDGFQTWEQQFQDRVYLRCVGFASATRGWVGTLTPGRPLYETADGGASWNLVTGLPEGAPSAVCGLSVVNESVAYASGTNYPDRPARMMRTVDGGASWQAWEMGEHATLLVDTYFTDTDHGWVVGGLATAANPTRDDVHAVVLRTEDGGRTWTDRAAPLRDQLPLGEWGWKIHFLDERVGYVALESFTRAALLKTTDGGDTWTRIDVHDPQGNANLEGVGFLDEDTGWVGGWGSETFEEGFSSATVDGGATWRNANEVGLFINRFRFFRGPQPIGYASGRTVYRYAAEPPEAEPRAVAPGQELVLLDDNAPLRTGVPLAVAVAVPEDAAHLTVDIWDRFGEHVRALVDEKEPAPGRRTVHWDATDTEGRPVSGSFLLRVTVDGRSESQIAHVTR
ncbi:YCF48-related protein [Pseudonocardia acaciae]|uniref:YCF48-related protein n=1 Tax=Pseudonocardia acaciae TaxID=551276 RepID=UPI0007E8C016|nr:YCF48-related protein [Pseudonocardia acaciae]